MHPQLFVNEHPPHGITGDAVHPFGDGRDVARQVERAGNDLVEAEHGVDGADLGVHVADPDEAVAFDAVPEIFLHVELNRISADLPDAVQPLVVATERADVWCITQHQHRAHLTQRHRQLWVHRVNPHKTKAARPDRLFAKPRQDNSLIAHGMIILCVLFPADVRHRLRSGFAEADPHRHRRVVARHGGEKLEVALHFDAEVQQDAAGLICGYRQFARRRRFFEHGLTGLGLQQAIRVLHTRLALPDDTHRRQKPRTQRRSFRALAHRRRNAWGQIGSARENRRGQRDEPKRGGEDWGNLLPADG